jgi:molecular chaperone DnaK (HSP70)
VRVAAERLKVDLSTQQQVTVALNDLMYATGGKGIQWDYTMTRAELDAILDPFIAQSLAVCENALGLLKASPRDFDRVVLVGGTTLSPRVRQRVAEFFGREPVAGLDPEEAVALGAAISSTIPVARKAKGVVPEVPGAGAVPTVSEAVDIEEMPPISYPMSQSFRPMAPEEEAVVRLASQSGAPPTAAKPPPRRMAIIAVAVLLIVGVAAVGMRVIRPPPAPPPTPPPASR